MKVSSQPHRLGWEDTTITFLAAVANDAISRFTDEPWAQGPFECRRELEEAVPSSFTLIIYNRLQVVAPEGTEGPIEDRALCLPYGGWRGELSDS